MSDGIVPLSRFQALLTRPQGKKRLDEILSHKNALERVAEMPLLDLYHLIKDVGLADAQELFELAPAEAVQGFLDLDGWDRDTLVPAHVRPWLAALVESGPQHLAHIWRQLDPELTSLILARWTRVYYLPEQDVPEDEEPPFYETPDGFFLVKITAESEDDVRLVAQILDFLYRSDAEQARHTLRQAGSETTAYLEEMSYRFRSGRLQELGYADYYDALEVYRPIDVTSVTLDEETAHPSRAERGRGPSMNERLPRLVADVTVKLGFLGKVLARVVQPEEASRLESQLVVLFNRVLAADGVEPGNTELAQLVSARAAGTLGVGLETVAQGDVDGGLAALRSVNLTRLHRVGATVLSKTRQLVDVLGARADRAGEPLAQVVKAIRERRPVFPRVLDRPPAAGVRPFFELADVRRVTAALGHLALQTRLVYDRLGSDPARYEPLTTLDDVGRTAALLAALGEPPGRPATAAEVQRFCQECLENGAVSRDARERAEAALGREFAPVIGSWMGELEDHLGSLDPSVLPEPNLLGFLLLGEPPN